MTMSQSRESGATIVAGDRRYANSLAKWERLNELVPGGSQTNSKRPSAFAFGSYPIFANHARGSHIWDVDGNEYVDFLGALGPIVLGYCDPDVDAAVREQLDRGMIYGLLAEAELSAAEAVVAAVPCAEQVRFLKSGAEATSAAARIARAATGRQVIVNCGYRGWHDGWNAWRNDGGIPTIFDNVVRTFTYNDLNSLEMILRANRGKVAAVMLDPVIPSSPAPGFLEGVAELARANGALLVYDEIVTGFRMALGGAQEYFGVIPDLSCFAKAMANGMPVAAVCGRRDVMSVTEKLIVTSTYGGEALSLAAATATIAKLRGEGVYPGIWRTGQRLMDGLNEVAREVGVPFRCHGFAPLSVMSFDDDLASRASDCWYHFLKETALRGVLFRRTGCNFISAAHTDEDIDRGIDAARSALQSLKLKG